MPQLTEAELTLQRKYAELRRKKEERKAKAAQEAAEKQPAAAAAQAATAADPKAALAKAKALLAKQGAGSTAKAEPPGPGNSAPVDPMAAAKAKLQQQAQKKAAAAQKRPTIKRPTVQRPAAPRAEEVSGSGRQAGGGEQRAAKRARTELDASELAEAGQGEACIFVGDLPPYYRREDVWQLFEHFGPVAEVRLMGQSCYGFVTFRQPAAAREVLASCQRKPLVASGHTLRVNTAHGQLPDWKRAPLPQQQGGAEAPRGGGGRGYAGGEHPKVAHAREYGEDLARQLLAAGAHGLDFDAKPQQRDLVSYDDL